MIQIGTKIERVFDEGTSHEQRDFITVLNLTMLSDHIKLATSVGWVILWETERVDENTWEWSYVDLDDHDDEIRGTAKYTVVNE